MGSTQDGKYAGWEMRSTRGDLCVHRGCTPFDAAKVPST